MKIVIARTGSEERAVVLPSSAEDPDAAAIIEAAAKAICAESTSRKADKRDGAKEAWSKWVRPVCYRFIEHCIAESLEDQLYKRLTRYRRYTNSEEIFSRCLLAIFAEDRASFTETDRTRLNRELWYAYRHYVPWQFLNGFLSQLKGFERQKALSKIEYGFDDWIAERRRVDDLMGARGPYPKRIEDKVMARAVGLVEFLDRIRQNEHAKEDDAD